MDKPHHISLRELMLAWNLHIKRIEPVLDVYKVETEEGPKALKGSERDRKAMEFIHSVLRYLKEQDFDKVLTSIPTSDGQDFIVSEGLNYSLYDWIDGRRPNFKNSAELKDACKTMAELHNASIGYHAPHGIHPRKRWGRLVESNKKHQQDLADFAEIAKTKRYLSRFDRDYLDNLPDYLEFAQRSVSLLDAEEYHQLVRNAKNTGCFCHGDVAERNFVLGTDKKMYLIDLDSCRLDLPAMDLVKLTRRVLKKNRWNPEVARTIIKSYQEVAPLNAAQIRLFDAVIAFPQKFWRIADRYYHKHRFSSEEKAYHKLRNILRQKDRFINFLHCYQKESPEWWGSMQ